jgi:hypothetical protein
MTELRLIGIHIVPNVTGVSAKRYKTKPQTFKSIKLMEPVRDSIRKRYISKWPKCEIFFEIIEI